MPARLAKPLLTLAALLGLASSPLPAPAAPVTVYYDTDALGSPVAATDAAGQVLWREQYRPYGERILKSPAAASNPRWYTGHPEDSETGFLYAGARYYDPVLGRFLAVDPANFSEKNLHSFNRYAYGNNNPYLYIDPDGRDAISFGIAMNLAQVPIKGLPFEGVLSGGFGFVVSAPGLTGGQFDVGLYRSGSGGYAFAPETSVKGLGKVVVDLTVAKGSVVDMESETTQNSFTYGPGGLHWSRDQRGSLEGGGVHFGGGVEVSSVGTKTEVWSARRGINRAVEASINAGKRFISNEVDKLFGPPSPRAE